jgi:hypothetical protein
MRFETLTEAPGLERPVVVALNVPLKQRDQVVESHVEIEYPFGGHRLTAQEALRDIGNSDQEVGNEAQTPSRPTAAAAGWGFDKELTSERPTASVDQVWRLAALMPRGFRALGDLRRFHRSALG